jgi:hypothetical protein
VEIKRRYTDVVALLRDRLDDRGGRSVGMAELVSQTLARGFKILVNEEILPIYSRNKDFARFLTEYIQGKPKWLA